MLALSLVMPFIGTNVLAQSSASGPSIKLVLEKQAAGVTLTTAEARVLAQYEARVAPTTILRRNSDRSFTDRAPATFDRGGDPIQISEVRIDQTGTDNDEYFELAGPSGFDLGSYTYLVIGDGTGGQGVIEAVVDLTGQSVPPSGYFVAAEASFTLGTADFETTLDFENGNRVTHLLVSGFTGASGDDLDTDDDGTLDVTPWSSVVDAVGFVNTTDTEIAYGAALGFTDVGPDGTFLPGYIYRDGTTGAWQVGGFDAAEDGGTPGAENASGGGEALAEEDFEGETFPPEGWAIFDNGFNGEDDAEMWQRIDFIGDGSNFVAASFYQNVDPDDFLAEDWLATPQFTPTASANTLVFYAGQTFTTDYGSTYEVLVSTGSQTDPADYTTVASYTEADFPIGSLLPFIVDLSAYNGTPIYVAFLHSNDDGDNFILDRVRVTGELEPLAAESTEFFFQFTAPVVTGEADRAAVVANVVVSGESGDVPVATSITFTTDGTTDVGDLASAQVFYTGSNTSLDVATDPTFGDPILNPDGTLTFTGSQELGTGDNFFWLTYSIAEDATPYNVVDGGFTSITVDGTVLTPDVTELDGNQIIAPAVPPNDDVIDAIAVEPTDSEVGSNINATAETGEEQASCSVFFGTNGDINASVYYEFTAPSDGLLTVDLRESGFDTIVTIHDPDDLSELACNDDTDEPIANGLASLIREFPVEEGETYLIRVSGWNEGVFFLDLTFTQSGFAEVDPASLTFELEQGSSESQTLALNNTGVGTLNYNAAVRVSASARAGNAVQNTLVTRGNRRAHQSGAEAQPAGAYRGGGTNYLLDPSFEAGTPNPFWDETSALFGTNIYEVAANTGTWHLYFGDQTSTDFEEASASQTVGVLAGEYTLSFFIVSLYDGTEGGSGSLTVTVGDQEVLSITDGEAADYFDVGFAYQLFEETVTLDGGDVTVIFDYEGTNSYGFWIDDVMLSGAGFPVTVSPESGTVAPGASQDLTVTVDASGLEPGVYEFDLVITTDSPSTPEVVVPVTVTVTPVVANEDGSIPTEFELRANYPNPFASATTIKYGLPEAERVKIDVYDAVGRHVATLVDEDQIAGYHETQWNAGAVASGVYMYRIQAGSNTRTIKMVVVR